MKLNEEQMAIIEKADQLTKCYSSTIEETHWLNEEEAYSLIESFVEIMDTPTNWRISELYNKLDAQDKIINEQALEIARLKEINNGIKEVGRKLLERLDIAIEYIKERTGQDWYQEGCFFDELLEILEGNNENIQV